MNYQRTQKLMLPLIIIQLLIIIIATLFASTNKGGREIPAKKIE